MKRTNPKYINILIIFNILYAIFYAIVSDIGDIFDLFWRFNFQIGFLMGVFTGLYYENFIVRDPDTGEINVKQETK